MNANIQIIDQYDDGMEAVTSALKLVSAYMATNIHQEPSELAACYAPSIKFKKNKTSTNAYKKVAVFDIDDTILFDNGSMDSENVVPNHNVLELLKRIHDLGVEIHLVTARLRDDDMLKATQEELENLGVGNIYKSLTLAPESSRKTMATVSFWKMKQRQRIAEGAGHPVILTVGDQWGDMVVLKHENDIFVLNDKYKAVHMPYILSRVKDGVSLWGLKLPAYT